MTSKEVSLEGIVTRIWEQVLEKEGILKSDQFNSLGGDPTKMIEVVFFLEKELQKEFPVEVMMMMGSIQEMVLAIESLDKKSILKSNYLSTDQLNRLQMSTSSIVNVSENDTLMVKMKDGNLPPLFWCFNSPGSEAHVLSDKLRDNQPLYALVSSVTLGKSPEILKNIAAHYVEEIINIQPKGPYYLGGNCRGAKVMCEILFQLEQRGKRVKRLCLLEFFHPILYKFTDRLMLIFGEKSNIEAHKFLNWGEEGWENKFTKVPDIRFIPCAHGKFFLNENIEHLGKGVNYFLRNNLLQRLTLIIKNKSRLIFFG